MFVYDALTNSPTLLVPARSKRKDETGAVSGKPSVSSNNICVFCKGQEHLTPPTLYEDAPDWNVRVFKNKFALVEDHEVVVHSPFDDKDFQNLPVEHGVKIIQAYISRIKHHNAQNKDVFLFNNKGAKAGASIKHPHTQLVALEIFPGTLQKERESVELYHSAHNSCYWCDLIKLETEEQTDKQRVIHESPYFVTLVPIASRWSFEMLLVPKVHKNNFADLSEAEITDLALVLKSAISAYDRLFGDPDRNFWVHTLRFEKFHWHLGLIPQIKTLGGMELGAGIWVSDKATPEDAAALLREPMNQVYNEEIFSLG